MILIFLFDVDFIIVILVEISFEGGYGIVVGMVEIFNRLNFFDGGDLVLGLVMVGIVIGVIVGMILVDWGRKNNYI